MHDCKSTAGALTRPISCVLLRKAKLQPVGPRDSDTVGDGDVDGVSENECPKKVAPCHPV